MVSKDIVLSRRRDVETGRASRQVELGVVRAERDAVLLGARDLAEGRERLFRERLGDERDARGVPGCRSTGDEAVSATTRLRHVDARRARGLSRRRATKHTKKKRTSYIHTRVVPTRASPQLSSEARADETDDDDDGEPEKSIATGFHETERVC